MDCPEPNRRPSLLNGLGLKHDVLCLEEITFVIYNIFSPQFPHEFDAFFGHLDSFAAAVPLSVGLELWSVPACAHSEDCPPFGKNINCSYHFREDCRISQRHWRNASPEPDRLRLCCEMGKKCPGLDCRILLNLQVFRRVRPQVVVRDEERIVTQRF